MGIRRLLIFAGLTAGLCAALLRPPVVLARGEILVFAAASLTEVAGELADRHHRETGVPVRLSFGASSTLARQIRAGAPVDVFLSADVRWVDYLEAGGSIEPSSRRAIAGNRLVIIGPASRPTPAGLQGPAALLGSNIQAGLAMGDPDHVPAGRYARAALTSLGLWERVRGQVVPTDNVRLALALVGRGEVPLGIVYESDARHSQAVRVLARVPETAHPPITYLAATLPGASTGAQDFVDRFATREAADLLREAGFRPAPDRDVGVQ